MSSFGVLDIAVSIDKFATDFIAALRADGISDTVEFYDFDSRNDFGSVPNVDLFGTNGFAFDEELGGFMTVSTAFISSTVEDRAGYRHLRIMHRLHQALRAGEMLPLVSAETGELITQMKIIEASLGPTVRSEVRPMQAYAFRMLPAFAS